ncbi:Similar to Chromosome transmission fidelity protein 8; acc. no. P38877 [Pyronema omphalodes CBS 100304]|uniref:Similar to Chromosome transmission fidelity protein 8 acc. no. P38877 n=1 Tax=Pyronema omphalodes (strain CBS 100304) TaxID=1076935 RepID=U4LHY9_PYROM|nr:Similar to Chromosome transmission fidelity protein 8; acc. no. P38877 [Pyronema omphalodes CBS 100304]
MPSIPLHLSPTIPHTPTSNPLPQLLQTPSGLALVELQGTLNHPNDGTVIGTFFFPKDDGKKVWLYIGAHQRMLGEIKKLSTPMGVLRRRTPGVLGERGAGDTEMSGTARGVRKIMGQRSGRGRSWRLRRWFIGR